MESIEEKAEKLLNESEYWVKYGLENSEKVTKEDFDEISFECMLMLDRVLFEHQENKIILLDFIKLSFKISLKNPK